MQVLTAGATGAAAGTAAGVSQAEVDAYIAQLEAEFGAGGAAAGGGAAGAGLATVGLLALDVGLLVHDVNEGQKLLCAYGVGCGNPSPSPKPPMAGRKCRDKDEDCEIQYENDSSVCRVLPDKNDRRRCWESAFKRYVQCLRGQPVQPLEW
jgi:hypothetical protein